MKIKKFTRVKYDYDSLPKEWRRENKNIFEGKVFMFLGKVKDMKGHSYLQCIETGKPHILHTDSLRVLTESEK